MVSSTYEASINLENLSSEEGTAFSLYLNYLMHEKLLNRGNIIPDGLFGINRRGVANYFKDGRFPRKKEWEQFIMSEGAGTYFTQHERNNLQRLYQGELPVVDAPVPRIITPPIQQQDVFPSVGWVSAGYFKRCYETMSVRP